jgi:acyl-CoA thioesterase FadM
LRWFQDAALHASAENGFGNERYRKLGTTWFVREYGLEIDGELREGEDVRVVTWAADFVRLAAHRQYRLERLDGSIIAKGEANWIYVDRVTGRPKRFDQEPLDEFPTHPVYVLGDRDWACDIVDAKAIPELPHSAVRDVRWSEVDGARHVNNAVYADWAVDHLAHVRDNEDGPGSIRRMRIRYDRSVPVGATVRWSIGEIAAGTWMQTVRDASDETLYSRTVIEVK